MCSQSGIATAIWVEVRVLHSEQQSREPTNGGGPQLPRVEVTSATLIPIPLSPHLLSFSAQVDKHGL